jgi:hypothetical protein
LLLISFIDTKKLAIELANEVARQPVNVERIEGIIAELDRRSYFLTEQTYSSIFRGFAQSRIAVPYAKYVELVEKYLKRTYMP